MNPLSLHEFHQSLGAHFSGLNGSEVVDRYVYGPAEHAALRTTAGVLDLSFRSRLCLTGADRARFLHGQVTNDVNGLRSGGGCYAAIVTAKGRMESDVNVYNLPDELLLDFEPGYSSAIQQRLEKYIVSDDVQVIDAAPHYGLLSVQGPHAHMVIDAIGLFPEIPTALLAFVKISNATLGDIYLMNQPRLNLTFGMWMQTMRDTVVLPPRVLSEAITGFDVFVPTASLAAVADKLITAARRLGGGACGWQAFETARIEAGIPRFGVDMDETNIPLECGIEARAVSYQKGCYIGQEVINRIHSIGHVNKELRGLRLADGLKPLPTKGDKLFKDGKEAGYLTSAVSSPTAKANIALGYVRREYFAVGTELTLEIAGNQTKAMVVTLPVA